jgi:hypothetical protein
MGSGAWYTMIPATAFESKNEDNGQIQAHRRRACDSITPTWWHDTCHVFHFLFRGAAGSGVLAGGAGRALASLMAH